jgi:hypothetical protein
MTDAELRPLQSEIWTQKKLESARVSRDAAEQQALEPPSSRDT